MTIHISSNWKFTGAYNKYQNKRIFKSIEENQFYLRYNDDGTWAGPYFQWSRAGQFIPYPSNWINMYPFFYDDWNGKHKENCYVDMCANDPCNGRIPMNTHII